MRIAQCSILLVVLMAASAAANVARVETGDLMELIDVSRLAYLRDSVCEQVSSFDRTGGNDDGFSGNYSFIRKEGENLVIFDEQGPGCIYRVWSANPDNGWIKFYFDGEAEPRLSFDHWADMFQNKKYPFLSPISQTFLGGWCSFVPIPFVKSCKIVAGGPVRFYQITWRRFASADGVKTFDPNYSAEDRLKLDMVRRAWSQVEELPMPLGANTGSFSGDEEIEGGRSKALFSHKDAGVIRALWLQTSSDDPLFIRKCLVQVYVDGNKSPNVDSPIGDLFLDPFGGETAKSLLIGKAGSGTYYSYFPMPFSAGVKIVVRNDGAAKLKVAWEVACEPMSKLPDGMGRFFAQWHRQNPTIKGQLFPILDAKGHGHWCGVSHAMQGSRGWGLGFLEGDEMLWIDGRDNTHYNGTGTEDYFNGGWYFGTTGNAPMYGAGVQDGNDKCHAFRIQMSDLVPFQKTFHGGIEHGDGNSVPADYAGVTYWYAAPGTIGGFEMLPVAARLIGQRSSTPGALEAESLTPPVSGKVVKDLELGCTLSAGQAVCGSGVSLRFKVDEADDYSLIAAIVTGPGYDLGSVSVDDHLLPAATPSKSKVATPYVKTIQLSPNQQLAGGEHILAFKPADRGGRVCVDYLRVVPTGQYEAEALPVAANPINAELRRPRLDDNGNEKLRFGPADKGASFTLKVPVAESGNYEISARLTTAADYGVFRLLVDGKPLGEPFDGYSEGQNRTPPVKFGRIELSAGEHKVTFEVIGKNDKSTGFVVGVDKIRLKKV